MQWRMKHILALSTLMLLSSPALAQNSCPVTQEDLFVARAYVLCQLPTDLEHCAQALISAGLLTRFSERHVPTNQSLQIEAVLASGDREGVIKLSLADWAAERARALQPRISKASLGAFLETLPTEPSNATVLEKAARLGLQNLYHSTETADLPIEATVFWFRNLPLRPESLAMIVDPNLTREQSQVLEGLLTDMHQSSEFKKELSLIHYGGVQLQSAVMTRAMLTRIGEATIKVTKKMEMGIGDSIARMFNEQSLYEVGSKMVSRMSDIAYKMAMHSRLGHSGATSILQVKGMQTARYLGGRAIALALGILKAPGLVMTAAEFTLKPSATACDTLDRIALPVNSSCEIMKNQETHQNVLSFLDQLVQPNPSEQNFAWSLLNYPETCSFYQDMSSRIRKQVEIRALSCRRSKIEAEMMFEGEAYQLQITLYSADSRNPGTLLQVVATLKSPTARTKVRHVNLQFNSAGDFAASDLGSNDAFRGLVRMNALRAANSCANRQ